MQAVNRVKADATAFTTNFYAPPARAQAWVDRQELFIDEHERAVFFFRRDRNFRHFFFCAAGTPELARALSALRPDELEGLTTDIVGSSNGVDSELRTLQSGGFAPRTRLVRLCRLAAGVGIGASSTALQVEFATAGDAQALLSLLEELFDPMVYQVPVRYELDAAIQARQILMIRRESQVDALLHFETTGVSSTLRFWAVSPRAQSAGLGSALLRKYLELHPGVRRFVLWVDEENQNARDKYSRFGYVPDGLFDHVLLGPGNRK